MTLSRRKLLQIGATGVAVGAAGGCGTIARKYLAPTAPADLSPPVGRVEPWLRVLNRVGYGPSISQVAPLDLDSLDGYVDQQLHEIQPESEYLTVMLRRLEALQLDDHTQRDLPDDQVLLQLQQAAILRAVYSKNQLVERMVEFWTDHFNLYAKKGYTINRIATDQTRVIRAHALGKFRDLLHASAKSPGMLVFLDNQVNTRGIPNENYARELLELHTLGVDGGYTIQDVQEVARCFTGWSVENRFGRRRGQFVFRSDLHDDGPKRVLGQRLLSRGGVNDGEQVLDLLASHPSTAKYLARKLCKYFLGHCPPSHVTRIADAFTRSQGDIRACLGEVLDVQQLLRAPAKLKRPFHYLVSALRATGAQTDGAGALQTHLEKMGQPLYLWPMPDGYPTDQDSWTGTLLARWNFAWEYCHGNVQGSEIPLKSFSGLAQDLIAKVLLLPKYPGSNGSQSPRGQDAPLALSICLASPEFQWS